MKSIVNLIVLIIICVVGVEVANKIVSCFNNGEEVKVVAIITTIVVVAIIVLAKEFLCVGTEPGINEEDEDDDSKGGRVINLTHYRREDGEYAQITPVKVIDNVNKFDNDEDLYVPALSRVEKENLIHYERIDTESIKQEVLRMISTGNRRIEMEVVERLNRLAQVEDTSEFMEENPQVLKFIFSY